MDLGVEYLYTTKVIDHKFRSVLHKAEDMDAIMAWFKEKTGVTDEEIAAAEAKEKEYVAGCLMLAKQYLGMGHCISGKTYLELAAAKGSEKAIAQLKDMEYAQDMYDLGEHYLAMGHCICSKTSFGCCIHPHACHLSVTRWLLPFQTSHLSSRQKKGEGP